MKQFLFAFFFLSNILAIAQNPCGTGNKVIPVGKEGLNDLNRIHENIQTIQGAQKKADTLIFPTVIHIFHDGSLGNITDSQVFDGLRVINEDFNRMNADTSVTRPIFKPFAAVVGYKFVLAKLDSNGDSTTGIVRIDTALIPHPEPTSPDFDNVKFASHWPSDMYYNIWLVRGIQGGTLGYAQYPGTNFTYGGPWETWGVVMRSDQFGTIGTSSADGRTATHEIGHTFGLYHTFLSSSAGCGTVCDTTGDEVCDTPPNTDSFSCPQTANTCSNDTSGPSAYTTNVVDQIENFMSYNSCQNMFSQGQKVRMDGFIASFPLIQGLSTDSNLIATGLLIPPVVGVDEVNPIETHIEIIPNPINDRFSISFKLNEDVEHFKLFITDLFGREVLSVANYPVLQKGKYTIEAELHDGVSPGIYFLISQSKSFIAVEKIVKQR